MDTSPVDAEEVNQTFVRLGLCTNQRGMRQLEQQDTDTTARLETIQLEIEQKKENIRVLGEQAVRLHRSTCELTQTPDRATDRRGQSCR